MQRFHSSNGVVLKYNGPWKAETVCQTSLSHSNKKTYFTVDRVIINLSVLVDHISLAHHCNSLKRISMLYNVVTHLRTLMNVGDAKLNTSMFHTRTSSNLHKSCIYHI